MNRPVFRNQSRTNSKAAKWLGQPAGMPLQPFGGSVRSRLISEYGRIWVLLVIFFGCTIRPFIPKILKRPEKVFYRRLTFFAKCSEEMKATVVGRPKSWLFYFTFAVSCLKLKEACAPGPQPPGPTPTSSGKTQKSIILC